MLARLIPVSFAVFRELIQSLLLLISLSVFILFLLYIAPGHDLLDEYLASLQDESPSENRLSFFDAYFFWLSTYLTGNFGFSTSNGMPVLHQVIDYASNTLILILAALGISLTLALPLAISGATHKSSIINSTFFAGLNLVSTLPLFWLCYICIYLAGHWLNYFPLASDTDDASMMQFLLPVLLLSLGNGVLVEIIHLIKNELRRVLNEEYILYARAKGASVMAHALKEGILFPLLTLFSNRIAYLFGASIIVEQIFNWPGIGRVLWQATQDRDIPLLLMSILVSALIIRVCYFITRVIYIIINPRASHE